MTTELMLPSGIELRPNYAKAENTLFTCVRIVFLDLPFS